MLLLLIRELTRRVTNDGKDKGVIVIQESLGLALVAAICLRLTRQEGLDLGPQAANTRDDGLVVSRLGAQGQEAMEELAEALRRDMRRGGHLGLVRASWARGDGVGQMADGLAVTVHDDLEARPEEHVGAVDVGVDGGDFSALQLKGLVLIETDT